MSDAAAASGLVSETAALIDEFCDALWLEDGLSRNTLDSYRRDLRQFQAWLEKMHGRDLLAATIKEAFYIATTGRPGPVLVDIPKDVTRDKCKFEYPASVSMRSYNPVVKGHQGQIRKAASLILNAERPMIYTGGGVILANAAELSSINRIFCECK